MGRKEWLSARNTEKTMMEQYSVLLLLPTDKVSFDHLKVMIAECGIKARYNTGPIYKALADTYAPVGRLIFPIAAQDEIFDPLDCGDYSDFDISRYYSAGEIKDIERNGSSNHSIAACYASVAELEALAEKVKDIGRCYVWHWHQWVLLSNLDQMNW